MKNVTFTESQEMRRKDFANLIQGIFFRVQLGIEQQRLFFVLRRINNKEISVLELSTGDNKNHLQQGQQLTSSTYHYDPIDCINIIETGELSGKLSDNEDKKRKYYNIQKYISDNLISIKKQSGGKDVIAMKFQGTHPSSSDFNPQITYWEDYDEFGDDSLFDDTFDYITKLSQI